MSFSLYEIPLTPGPQALRVVLAGIQYRMAIYWRNTAQAGWTLDISNAQGTPIISGIPLVTGVDLLAQYKHLGIAGKLICQNDNQTNDAPTFLNLGITTHLYFVPN